VSTAPVRAPTEGIERTNGHGRRALLVTVIGAGYVGTVSAVVLAYLGHRVTCVERDPARLEQWRNGGDPLGEPGLAELRTDVDVEFVGQVDAVSAADVIVLAVGTPTDESGRPDVSQVDAAAAEIAASARDGALVLVRSTVPVGTCDRLQRTLLQRLHVVSNPEFLREGHALRDSFFPDRIVVGGPSVVRPIVEDLYRRIIEGRDLPGASGEERTVPLLWMSARSAELAKYAANGFLATKLSFVNEIANIAEAVGADATAVLESMALDPRIGSHYLRPGLGWGGSCFPKDTKAFQAIANGEGYDFVVLRAAIEQNARQLSRFAEAIERALPHDARVGLLGLAFKAGTSDTRESPAIALARLLLRHRVQVRAYDPAVRELASEPGISVLSNIVEACEGADAVIIATEWQEFAETDLTALRAVTRGDLMFDGRSLISPIAAARAGFSYHGVAGVARQAREPRPVREPAPELAERGADVAHGIEVGRGLIISPAP
jgi:UDPglucose 6-dehydrogenase